MVDLRIASGAGDATDAASARRAAIHIDGKSRRVGIRKALWPRLIDVPHKEPPGVL